MDQEELKQDRELDPAELDVAALEQADLYGKWAERAAEAKSKADNYELDLEITEARLQHQVRVDPKAFGIESGGEGAIKAYVKAMPEYEKAARLAGKAKAEAGMLAVAEKSLAQRKSMIEELVKLHGQQYFAGPDVPHDLLALWQARRERKSGTVVSAKQREQVRRRGQSRYLP